ncbi:MAG: T9SS type A sorting domain-containing protein [Confluentibacter sp.]|nr:T9SS type A sorting domain-containing protein [Confluentibacter sp.]HMR16197.1 T9SS type A sorting domain-containing protein [Mariniflexile sp.]
MKKTLLLVCALTFSMSLTFAQVILHEPFNYSDGATLSGQTLTGVGTWSNYTGNTPDDMLITLQPVWNNFGLPAPTGNAIKYQGGGSDLMLNFPTVDSGTIYFSFLMQIIDFNGNSTDPVIDPYRQLSLSINAAGNVGPSLFIKNGSAPDKFNVGYSPSDVATEAVYSSTDYSYGSEFLFVMSYTIGTSLGKLWVNPTVSSTEPAEVVSSSNTSKPRTSFNGVVIQARSNASNPNCVVDEIRVAKSWPEVLGLPALSVSKNNIEGLKIYPNPAKDYISIESKNTKISSVEMYNVLGAKVISEKALVNNRLNVSHLSKGIYMLKVNAENGSATKKILID